MAGQVSKQWLSVPGEACARIKRPFPERSFILRDSPQLPSIPTQLPRYAVKTALSKRLRKRQESRVMLLRWQDGRRRAPRSHVKGASWIEPHELEVLSFFRVADHCMIVLEMHILRHHVYRH